MNLFYCVLAFAGCGFIGMAIAVRYVLLACERLFEDELHATLHIYYEPDPE